MNYWKHESRLRLTGRSAAYSSNQLTRWFIGSEFRRELSWRLPSELKWASGVVSYRPQNFRWGGEECGKPLLIRAFVVWEPVLPTDWSSPSIAPRSRLSDVRVTQFWDKGRVISQLMAEHDRRSVVWGYIAVYPAGAICENLRHRINS